MISSNFSVGLVALRIYLSLAQLFIGNFRVYLDFPDDYSKRESCLDSSASGTSVHLTRDQIGLAELLYLNLAGVASQQY